MNYLEIKYCDISNGPGVRISIFASGCHFGCKGCFNSVAWDRDSGEAFDREVMDKILDQLSKPYISGISLLGGEPLEPYNLEGINFIIDSVRERFGDSKTIWIYSGFVYEDMNEDQKKTVEKCDVLVDGPFIEELKDPSLKFRGSSNQRIIDPK